MTGQDECAGSRVAAILEGLALQQASGVLRIDGDPSGAVHLDVGYVTLAESSWTPGLAARMRTAVGPGAGRAPAPTGPPGGDNAALLERRGLLTGADIQAIRRSVTVDAVITLTVPLPGGSTVRGTTFEPARGRRPAALPRLSVTSVLAEATARGERLARHGLAPTTRMEMRDLVTGAVLLSREQWSILCAISGPVSAVELALRQGLALYDTAARLGELAAAGVCAPIPAHTGRAPARGTPGLPRRRETEGAPDKPPAGPATDGGEVDGLPLAALSPELLLRVLEGLKRLD